MAQTALRRGTQEDGNTEYFTGCPIGGGFIWYGLPDKIPSNCRICDNSTLAISSFAKLYENLDGAWGESGANMSLPDLRGRFPRGVDGGAGNDPDRLARTGPNPGQNVADAVGSVQEDVNKLHGHPVRWNNQASASPDLSGGIVLNSDALFDTPSYTGSVTSTRGQNIGGDGGSESRPKNANVYFVIRVS
jgi:microcystin-dependent protein